MAGWVGLRSWIVDRTGSSSEVLNSPARVAAVSTSTLTWRLPCRRRRRGVRRPWWSTVATVTSRAAEANELLAAATLSVVVNGTVAVFCLGLSDQDSQHVADGGPWVAQ
jgi:hypothetical protein